MARELLTSWAEFQTAIDRLLASAEKEIQIHDGDLARFLLDSAPRLNQLKRLLGNRRTACIRIVLRDITQVRQKSPHLMRLLSYYPEGISVLETPDHLEHLRDSLFLVDNRHGIVLFERSQPRFKLLIDESDEIEPYRRRFEEIWQEGGTPLGPTILGL